MKIERIIAIIMLLLEQKKISAPRLAEMFEVTTRTIYRDIETINAAGIPIITYPGIHGGIGIMEQYKIEKRLFTMSDITSLLTGLGNIPLSSEDILNTVAKVKGLLPKEQVQDIELQSNKIIVDYTPWYGNKTRQAYLQEIYTALKKNQYVSFEYKDNSGKISARKVEPYRLILKNSNWYLQSFCTLRQEFRTFRLSRITSLLLLDEIFTPREIELNSLDQSNLPLEIKKIKLLVDDVLQAWMTEFCGEENVTPYGDDKLLVDFPFIESDYGYSFLLRFGDKCVCLEPEDVRQEVKRRTINLLKLYQKNNNVE